MSGILSHLVGDCPEPDPRADPLDSLVPFADPSRKQYVPIARRWIRTHHLDANGLSPEGAVHAAWLLLCECVRDGRIEPIHSPGSFDRIFTILLRHLLADEWRRQHARKRSAEFDDSAVLDSLRSRERPPDEHVIAKEQVERLLDLLDCEDPLLRHVAIRRTQGISNATIACELDVSRSTVERTLRRIREILGPRIDTNE